MIALPYPSHRRSPPFPFSPFFAPLHARKKAEKTPPPCFPSPFPFAWLLLSVAKLSDQGKESVILVVVVIIGWTSFKFPMYSF